MTPGQEDFNELIELAKAGELDNAPQEGTDIFWLRRHTVAIIWAEAELARLRDGVNDVMLGMMDAKLVEERDALRSQVEALEKDLRTVAKGYKASNGYEYDVDLNEVDTIVRRVLGGSQ